MSERNKANFEELETPPDQKDQRVGWPPKLSEEEFQLRLKLRHHAINFANQCFEHLEVFKRKNQQYQNAIEETGVLGAATELVGCTSRLKGLVIRNPTHGRDQREAIYNAAQDAHNYANILLQMMEQDNWEGTDDAEKDS